MIGCEFPACVWSGYEDELAEHLYLIHDSGPWRVADECKKCYGWGTVDDKHDWERVDECPACRGTGRIA